MRICTFLKSQSNIKQSVLSNILSAPRTFSGDDDIRSLEKLLENVDGFIISPDAIVNNDIAMTNFI